MFENTSVLLGISTLVAGIPAAIWLYFIFSQASKSKKVIALVFGLGCLTAPALLGLQYVWNVFPQFNLDAFIQDNVQTQNTRFIATFVLFGALEEIIKMFVVTSIEKRTVLISTLNDAIRYSLAAALGFSFTENIYYLYQFWPSISGGELFGMYIFRSTFTTCAHLIFSGIFGYFYGIGKFSIHLTEQAKLTGKKSKIVKAIGKVFSLPFSQAHQQYMITKGLFIAVTMHAIYNYLLQFNILPPVIIFVVLGYIYLQYLLSRKAGHLVLSTDISEKQKSSLAKKDEDVVIELLGMWFNDNRYVDVIHTCERLLERDPDNNVVKIFKAKALDKMDNKDTYKSILGNMFKSKDDISKNDKNIIAKYTTIKEEENKKRINNKDKATTQETNKAEEKNESKQKDSSKNAKEYLNEFTDGDTFEIK